MPALEILSRRPADPPRPAPLLFVHGAFCSAAIWDARFLAWFAERGWAAHAVSLRGHGRSAGRDRLRWHRLEDYVDDVVAAIDAFPTPPVLIGHSMGGLVVQRALRRRRAPAAVLLASVPPQGLLAASVSLAWRDPYLFHQMSVLTCLGERHVDPAALRRVMFSPRMPPRDGEAHAALLQDESRAVLLDMMVWQLMPPVPDPDIPMMVAGGAEDLLVPPDQLHLTAWMMGRRPVVFPGMGHTLMLEPGWDGVAAAVHGWLAATLPAREASDRPAASAAPVRPG